MAARTKQVAKLLNGGKLKTVSTFQGRNGPVEMRDPDGSPSDKQLWMLRKKGMLAIVEPGTGQDFTKGEASWALDQA